MFRGHRPVPTGNALQTLSAIQDSNVVSRTAKTIFEINREVVPKRNQRQDLLVSPPGSSPLADLQHRQKGFLRDVDAADALHALFAFFLFFEELALSRDVAAVAFCQHVLANSMDGFAGDNFCADGRLNGDLEHLPWNKLAHFRDQGLSAF